MSRIRYLGISLLSVFLQCADTRTCGIQSLKLSKKGFHKVKGERKRATKKTFFYNKEEFCFSPWLNLCGFRDYELSLLWPTLALLHKAKSELQLLRSIRKFLELPRFRYLRQDLFKGCPFPRRAGMTRESSAGEPSSVSYIGSYNCRGHK